MSRTTYNGEEAKETVGQTTTHQRSEKCETLYEQHETCPRENIPFWMTLDGIQIKVINNAIKN